MTLGLKSPAVLVAAVVLGAGVFLLGRGSVTSSQAGIAGAGSAPVAGPVATRNPNLVGEWMVDGWAYAIWFYADGSGVTKTEPNDNNKGQPTLTRRFRWETRQESVIVSGVSGDELPAVGDAPAWPPKDGEYPLTYRSGTSIPGTAFLNLINGSAAWAFERR